MKYNCKMYSAYDGQQIANVCLTGINNAEAFEEAIRQRLKCVDEYIELNYNDDSSWSVANRPKNRVQTESDNFNTRCTAEELVYFTLNVLMETEPQATMTEMSFNDVVYRNITDIKKLDEEPELTPLCLCTFSYSFVAEKAGVPCRGYAFPSYSIPENRACVLEKLSGHGIVDIPFDSTATKHIYIGCCMVYAVDECVDYARDYDKAHMFIEATEDSVQFKVLVDNKLQNKISYVVGNSLTYCFTPFETSLHQEDVFVSPDRCTTDIVFNNTDGVYICNSDFGFSGMSVTPPALPAFEDMTAAASQDLFGQLVRLYFDSCGTAQIYKNGRFTFTRYAGTDIFYAQYEDIHILGRMEKCYTNCPDIYFYESFDSPYSLFINSVELKTDHSVTSLYGFSKSDLDIRFNDGTNEPVEVTFSELKKHNMFINTPNIPDNIYFYNNSFYCIFDKLSIMTAIAKQVATLGAARLAALSSPHFLEDPFEMQNAIYEANMTPDPDVVAKAVEIKKCFNRTGVIPNIAIIGEAGCGKSTLIKKLGKVFDKEVLCLSPSDLKGAYVGHTKGEVLEKLVLAMKENKIFFIDEVYELMTDSFGREAISLLLPLMTGDRTSAEARIDKEHISVDFLTGEVERNGNYESYPDTKGVPPIWIAGYEDDVRLMLSQNQGLFRRFERLTLKPPHTRELYSDLLKKLEIKLSTPESEAIYNCIKKLFEDNKKLIMNYFRWGNQPQNSKYFANYAGVEKLLNSCIDRLPLDKSEDELRSELESIISGSKRDIKRQLATLKRKSGTVDTKVNDADRIEIISDIDTRFSDLVGCENQIEYMRSIIRLLVNNSRYDSYNITVPKGALLKGLPGVGKTFISRAFAGEMQEAFEREAPDKRVGFMALSAPALTSRETDFISTVFDAAEEYDFCVIFIDEVDAIAIDRRINPYYSHYLELIKQMDGIEKRSNFFILAATNAPERLDPAFIRSGRVDKELEFLLPDKEARSILAERAIASRIRLLNNFVYSDHKASVRELSESISKHTLKYTAGDIENVINAAFIMYDNDEQEPTAKCESGSKSIKFGHSELDRLYGHIREAIEIRNIGERNPSAKENAFKVDANDNSCSATAIHEVGHALVSILCGEKPFDKITILPRGNALGYVSHNSEGLQMNKKALKDRIRVAMGGRIAEALVYGDEYVSSGASQDMTVATNLARYMVETIGFTDDLGFMTLVKSTSNFLGGKEYTCSDAFRERSDEAVCRLLRDLYSETVNMLSDKKELIISLAERVFNAETMSGSEFIEAYNEIYPDTQNSLANATAI